MVLACTPEAKRLVPKAGILLWDQFPLKWNSSQKQKCPLYLGNRIYFCITQHLFRSLNARLKTTVQTRHSTTLLSSTDIVWQLYKEVPVCSHIGLHQAAFILQALPYLLPSMTSQLSHKGGHKHPYSWESSARGHSASNHLPSHNHMPWFAGQDWQPQVRHTHKPLLGPKGTMIVDLAQEKKKSNFLFWRTSITLH